MRYFKIAKRVLRYLKKIIYLKITYGTDKAKTSLYNLIRYVDSNYVNNLEDYKSIIRQYLFVNRAVILCYSKK